MPADTIPAGDRRHRVTIARRSSRTDGSMESVATWTPTEKRWAQIRPLSARELLLLGDSQNIEEVTHTITMNFTKNISHKDRILYHGRTFEISGIINVGELDRELQLTCIERIGGVWQD